MVTALADRVVELVDNVRVAGTGGQLLPWLDAFQGELRAVLLDEPRLAHLAEVFARLSRGALRLPRDASSVDLAVFRAATVRGTGDALAGLGEVLRQEGFLEVRASTLAYWCGRHAGAGFPADLHEELRQRASRLGVVLTPANGPVQADSILRFQATEGPLFEALPEPTAECDRLPGDDVLRAYTPFHEWRSPSQRDIVAAMTAGGARDVVGVLPTGGGKSLTFVLPALIATDGGRRAGLTLVISPIIALMNDQVVQVARRYIAKNPAFRVGQLNSTIASEERSRILKDLDAGKLHLLYLSPETALAPWFLHRVLASPAPVQAFVIDEAHMIREWGEDFRCDFQRLGAIRELLHLRHHEMRTLVLSATMTEDTMRAVQVSLRIDPARCQQVLCSPLRSELYLGVDVHLKPSTKDNALLDLVERLPRPGIVYCTRRSACQEVRALLARRGIRATEIYNGETPIDQRQRILAEFQAGLIDVIIATNAFGLGVDKADVRFVIHYQVPDSLDRYFQEIGRGGRDGRPARATLLYSPSDMGAMHRQAVARLETAKVVGRFRDLWEHREAASVADGRPWWVLDDARVPPYAREQYELAERDPESLHRFWNHVALNFLERAGLIRIEGTAVRAATVVRTVRPLGNAPQEQELDLVLGAASQGKLDLPAMSRSSRTPLRVLEAALFRAVRLGMVRLEGTDLGTAVSLSTDVDGARLADDLACEVDAHRDAEKTRERNGVRAMRDYSRATNCRETYLAQVYGAVARVPCGHCDRCAPLEIRVPEPTTRARREDGMQDPLTSYVLALTAWYHEDARGALDGQIPATVLEELERQCKSLEDSAAKPAEVEVAFLGSTTVGKSTTINALLRRSLLPLNKIGSTTAAQVVVRYGTKERLTVRYAARERLDNQLTQLRIEWRRIDEDAEIDGGLPSYEPIERLRSIARSVLNFPPNHTLRLAEVDRPIREDVLARLGSERSFEGDDLFRHLQEHLVAPPQGGGYWAIVEQAELEIPEPFLSEGLRIVDLPGTGDTDRGRVEATMNYVKSADQFVLLLSNALVTEDVQALLNETDLLVNLFQRQRPLVVVGTKLDTANAPSADDLEQLTLPRDLSGMRAIEQVWCVKARQRIHELMQKLVARIDPRQEGESPDDYNARLLDRFARTEFIPTNPRASLELDPKTAGAVSPVQQQAWREKYPAEEDAGIPRLRQVLVEMARQRREEYRSALAARADRFKKLVKDQLEPDVGAPTSDARQAIIERAEIARRDVHISLAELRAELEHAVEDHHRSLRDQITELRKSNSAHGGRRIRNHLMEVHHQTMRASVRVERNGVFKVVHMPKAMFESLQLALVDRWHSLRTAVGERFAHAEAALVQFHDALAASFEATTQARTLQPVLEGWRVLLVEAGSSARDAAEKEIDRIGLHLPDRVIKCAQVALARYCTDAEAIRGKDFKKRFATHFEAAAATIGDKAIEAILQVLDQATKELSTTLGALHESMLRGALQAVLDDLERTLGSGLGAGLHDATDARRDALERAPPGHGEA